MTSCDTSSEVSDEGYKSSQGNVSNKLEENSGQLEPQLDTADASQQGRLRDFLKKENVSTKDYKFN